MQIREQGRLIQCIRSTYDKDKGRSFQKVVATLKRWHSEVPTEGMDGLTDEEKQELAAWLAERQAKSQATDRAYAVSGASGSLDRIVQALAAGVEPSSAQAVAIWKGLTDLGKALRKAGHPKPKPAPKPIPAAASKPAEPVRASKPKQPATKPPSKARAARVAPSDAKPAASASPSKPDKSVSTPKGKGGEQR